MTRILLVLAAVFFMVQVSYSATEDTPYPDEVFTRGQVWLAREGSGALGQACYFGGDSLATHVLECFSKRAKVDIVDSLVYKNICNRGYSHVLQLFIPYTSMLLKRSITVKKGKEPTALDLYKTCTEAP